MAGDRPLPWIALIAAAMILFISSAETVLAPPSPRVIRGTVYTNAGSQVPAGTPVEVRDLNTSQVVRTATAGPAGTGGAYAVTISGNAGDRIRVRSWDATMWGETNASVRSTTTTIPITLNMTRSSETHVTITSPADYASYSTGSIFTIQATVVALGNVGLGCRAVLSLSSPGIVALDGAETYVHELGLINRGQSVQTTWNMRANFTGTINAMVDAACDSDFMNLENRSRDVVIGLTVTDDTAPSVRVMSPRNGTRINDPVDFIFNVSDGSPIQNCSLFINDILQDTIYSPQKDIPLTFLRTVGTKDNTWYVVCTEDSSDHRTGTTGVYSLIINSLPRITAVSVDSPISLVAAGTREVICNGTVTDEDSWSDVTSLNATFYSSGTGIQSGDDDYRSNHYTNLTCSLVGISASTADFTCSFPLMYYASNGTWTCNVTAVDSINSTNSSHAYAQVSELLAIGISQSTINYGVMKRNEESLFDEEVNITNFGNVRLDMELFGYAIMEPDNMSMACDTGNISLEFQRYSDAYGTPFDSMSLLGAQSSPSIVNLDLLPRSEDSSSSARLYWKLKVPISEADGSCRGRIVFTARTNI